MPPHLRNAYPVHANYSSAKQNSALTKCLTDDFEVNAVTYSNGNHFSMKMYRKLNQLYTYKLEDYYSICRCTGGPHEDYVRITDFITAYPPTGDTIRNRLLASRKSRYTPTLVSNYDRLNRELQSVEPGNFIAVDHTAEVAKNYSDSDAKYVFDIVSQTGECVTAVMTNSTRVAEAAHAVEQVARRP